MKTTAPKYRAYKPVKMTDGLQTWIDHRFDMTQELTPDDLAALDATDEMGTPRARILEMKEQLDALDVSANPAIRLHADKIRELHTRLSILATTSGQCSSRDMDLLKDADHLWLKIMVLRDVVPKAVMGAKHSKTQSKRRADKPADDPYDVDRNARIRAFHARLIADGRRDATAQTAAEFGLSPRQISRILNK